MRSNRLSFGILAVVSVALGGDGCASDDGVAAGADAESDAGADAVPDSGTDAAADADAEGDAEADADRGPMQLVMFPDAAARGAVCNDGTAAGYYHRPGAGQGSTVWVIHLQGGGMCWDADSCDDRALQFPERMTSAQWPEQRLGQGAHSVDPAKNPDFWDAHHVYVPYCSSDLWSGDRDASDATGGRSFRGRRIVEVLPDDLTDVHRTTAPNLADATRVLFSGSSAGGGGVLANLDDVAARLPAADVRGFDDAGWFVDLDPYDQTLPSLREAAALGRAFWSGRADASCDSRQPDDAGACWVGPVAYPEIATPMMVQIAQHDGPQLALLGVTPPLDADERAYAAEFGRSIVASLEPVAACFSPAGSTHGLLVGEELDTLAIDGITLQQVLGRFFFDRDGATCVVAR